MSSFFSILWFITFLVQIYFLIRYLKHFRQVPRGHKPFGKALFYSFLTGIALLFLSVTFSSATPSVKTTEAKTGKTKIVLLKQSLADAKKEASTLLLTEKEQKNRVKALNQRENHLESAISESTKAESESKEAESIAAESEKATAESNRVQTEQAAAQQAAAESQKAAAAQAEAERQQQVQAAASTSTPPRGDMNTSQMGQIIGNINSKIYHVPGQAGYNMNSANAIYFDSEDAAIAAGYRKSKR